MAKLTVRGLARRILSRGEARRVSGPRSASGAPLSRFVGFGLSNWRGGVCLRVPPPVFENFGAIGVGSHGPLRLSCERRVVCAPCGPLRPCG